MQTLPRAGRAGRGSPTQLRFAAPSGRVLLSLLLLAACDLPANLPTTSPPAAEGEGEEGEGEEGEGEGGDEGEGEEGEGEGEGEGTNIGFGGAGDFGFVRRLLDDNRVPQPEDIDDVGFFAEHHTELPPADCGQRVCPHAMLGVMANLVDGRPCTVLQIGLNSPLTVDPDARPPLTLAVAVDVSGSMAGGDKIGFVRQGLARLVNELDDADQLAIVAYSTGASVRQPMVSVGGNRNALLDVVASLAPEGGTNIFDGLDTAFGEVEGAFASERQHRVVLLSDGVATSGNTDSGDILSMARAHTSEGIPLTTIGVGVDFDLELMRTLAEDGDGNFYFLDDASAVDEVFTEEVATFLVPVAFDVTLQIDLGSEWNIRNSFGVRDFVIDDLGRGGSVTIPAVYLAGRTSDDDVFQGSGRRGGGSALLLEIAPAVVDDEDGSSQIGDVQVQFRGPGAAETVTLSTSTQQEFSAGITPTRGFFEDRIVEKSFVMLNLLVGMQSASRAFYADQSGEAVSILENLVAAAADYEDSANDGAGDEDIAADIELLEQFRDVLISNGAVDDCGDECDSDDPWPAD